LNISVTRIESIDRETPVSTSGRMSLAKPLSMPVVKNDAPPSARPATADR